MVKFLHLPLSMLLCVLLSAASCNPEPEPEPTPNPEPTSPIVGTWVCETYESSDDYFDTYTLVFSQDNTGYIRNDYGTRASASEQMNFDWALTMTANGQYLLSVIYKSGDRNMDGPFSGGYAQYNRTVTIAGSTLSILTDDSTVMLFRRK